MKHKNILSLDKAYSSIFSKTDISGKPVKKVQEQYPYSYDPYALWIGNYDCTTDIAICSDRMMKNDLEKFNECCEKVFENHAHYFVNRKPEDVEKFICYYLNKKIELTGIEQGCNMFNGFPYWIFYYKECEEK